MLIEDGHVHIARSRGYSQRQFTGTVLRIDQPVSQIPLLNIMLRSHETLLISDLQDYQTDDPGRSSRPGPSGRRGGPAWPRG
jgi:hypothetical protein